MSALTAATQYVKAARVDEVPVGGKTVVEVNDRLLVLFHMPDGFFALDDLCTHDDGPLSDGVMSDKTIACPRHGAMFDIRTGAALTMPATRATQAYPCKVENGDVLIAIGGASSPAETSTAAPSGQIADVPVVAKPVGGQASDTSSPAAPPITEPAAVATGEVNEDVLREALKAVIDPELFVNIVDLGLVYNVTVSDRTEDDKKHVVVEMTMTSPACPAGPQLLQGSKDALSRVPGVGSNEVKLVMIPPWTPDRMTEAAKDQLGIF